jgi:hypothetical protein
MAIFWVPGPVGRGKYLELLTGWEAIHGDLFFFVPPFTFQAKRALEEITGCFIVMDQHTNSTVVYNLHLPAPLSALMVN